MSTLGTFGQEELLPNVHRASSERKRVGHPRPWMSRWKLGSMNSKWVITLLLNGGSIGNYTPLILTFDPSTSWDIQVLFLQEIGISHWSGLFDHFVHVREIGVTGIPGEGATPKLHCTFINIRRRNDHKIPSLKLTACPRKSLLGRWHLDVSKK